MKNKKEDFLKVLEANKLIVFKVSSMYCRNPDDREDLVQEIIIQLWNSYAKYDSKYKLSTWIYQIALNVAISFYRKSSVRKKYIMPIDASFVQIAEEQEEDNSEEIKLLRQFISELDELNRALMILYLDGHSHEEIANILNISKSNVGTKINRIKQKLKTRFQKLQK